MLKKESQNGQKEHPRACSSQLYAGPLGPAILSYDKRENKSVRSLGQTCLCSEPRGLKASPPPSWCKQRHARGSSMEPPECSRGRELPFKATHSTLDNAPATAGRRTSERSQCRS